MPQLSGNEPILGLNIWWYVECHITPHGLRFMALRR
jgi:hypothetical protein